MASIRAFALSSRAARQSGQPALNSTSATLRIPANAVTAVISAVPTDAPARSAPPAFTDPPVLCEVPALPDAPDIADVVKAPAPACRTVRPDRPRARRRPRVPPEPPHGRCPP